MPRFAAFLRGINVGAHKVPMADLRRILAELGCTDVATLLNSGNAVFSTTRRSAPALERDLAAALRADVGFEVPTLLRTDADLVRIASVAPFGADAEGRAPDTRLHITFTERPVTARVHEVLAATTRPGDELAASEREVYWLRAGRMTDAAIDVPTLLAGLSDDLGAVTARTAATVRKVAAALHP